LSIDHGGRDLGCDIALRKSDSTNGEHNVARIAHLDNRTLQRVEIIGNGACNNGCIAGLAQRSNRRVVDQILSLVNSTCSKDRKHSDGRLHKGIVQRRLHEPYCPNVCTLGNSRNLPTATVNFEPMSTRLHAPEAPVLTRTPDHSSSAVGFLLGYMKDAPPSLGLNRLKPRAERFSDSEGAIAGHTVFIPVPKGGFNEGQASALEVYARSLTYWRKIRVEFEWNEEEIRVHFRRPETAEAAAEEEKARWTD